MRNKTLLAAFAVAFALHAWNSHAAFGQPRPPGPPMMGGPRPPMGGGRPPGPVMGPGGGPGRNGGIRGPGGIGPARRPAGVARPGGIGRAVGSGGPGRPGVAGAGAAAGRPGRPLGPTGPARPAGPWDAGGNEAAATSPRGLGGPGSLARSAADSPNSPTAAVNHHALAQQANLVRSNYNFYGAFDGDWWGRHSGAWYAARWTTAAAAYSYPTWSRSYGYCGYTDYPLYYDYGSNVVYERQYVYVNGDRVATQDQYAQQASAIADTGKGAQAGAEDDWLPLGVFAMTQRGQVDGNDLFQLAVNKSGVIRGNYYTAISDSTLPVYGSVDEKTQRAAWTVGDRKEPVFEAGFANLTKSETTMLVHWGKDRAQQWNLVRIEQRPETNSSPSRHGEPGLGTSEALPER